MTIDVNDLILYVAAAIGVATTFVTLLSKFIVPLRDLAKLTKMTADDEWVERLNGWLHAALQVLLFVGKLVAPIALRSPTRVFPKSPTLGRPVIPTATPLENTVIHFGDDDDEEETNFR